MDRSIICFRVPSFEIALGRLTDSTLRDRPVAVATPRHPRAVLREVSREAEAEGVSIGMTVQDARWLCPSIRLVPPSPSRLRQGQDELQDVVRRFAPTWEQAAPGHMFMDVTGTHRLFGPATDIGMRIEREMRGRHGLAGAAGVGTNKLVTDVAATVFDPGEVIDVVPGQERAFMAPLPATVLPELSGSPARPLITMLEDLNLTTLGAIAGIPVSWLRLVIPDDAEALSRRARGIDATPVFPALDHPRVVERADLEPDTIDADRLRGALSAAVERVCRVLRQRRRVCRLICVTVVHTDGVEHNGHERLAAGASREAELLPCAVRLLSRAARRRVRVRTLIVEAGGLEHAATQVPLFAEGPADERACRLTAAVDQIRERFGDRSIRRGAMV